MATKRSVSASTRDFRRLFELTKQLGLIDSSLNYNSIVQKKTERWNILLDIWQKNTKRYGSVFFYNPLVHIFYGMNMPVKSQKVHTLLDTIEDVMLNNNEAFDVWVRTKAFKRAYHNATQRAYQLNLYREFQHACGAVRLLGGKTITNTSKQLRGKDCYTLYQRYISKLMLFQNEFKTLLGEILPVSVGWPHEQWINYDCICEALKQKYGVDFSQDSYFLNSIFYLMEYRDERSNDMTFDDIISAPLNYAFFKAIFPTETEEHLWNLFNLCRCKYNSDNQVEKLKNSWIFDIVRTWAYDKAHPYHDTARKTVFDLLMGASV